MAYYMIDIENLEPLKIGATGSKANQTEKTLNYIPGSSLRGAWINRFFSNQDLSELEKIEALTEINFLNAYPVIELENGDICQAFPTPRCIRSNKHTWRAAKADKRNLKGEKFYKLTNLICKSNGKNSNSKNNLEYSYLAIREKTKKELKSETREIGINNSKEQIFEGVKISKTYRLHHNKRKRLTEINKENLFRYEAIDKNQNFRAYIFLSDNSLLKPKFEKLLKETKKLNVGGSKTSGYGACKIKTNAVSMDKNKLNQMRLKNHKLEDLEAGELIVTALSDCVFRNNYGQLTEKLDFILEEEIKNLEIDNKIKNNVLNKENNSIKLEKTFLDTSVTEGYNSKWKARLPKETSIKAGSMWKYTINGFSKIEIDKLVDQIDKKLHGEKQSEGYGWLVANVKYPDQILMEDDIEELKKIHEEIETISKFRENIALKKTNKNTFEILLNGFSESRLDWVRSLVKQDMVGINDTNISDVKVDKDKLNQSRKRNLIEGLKLYIESYDPDEIIKDDENESKINKFEKYVQNAGYTNDNKIFSFQDKNFKYCYEYLNSINIDKNKDFSIFENFAKNQLNTIKGQLYYGNRRESENKIRTLFFAEYLKEYIYVLSRMDKEAKTDGK